MIDKARLHCPPRRLKAHPLPDAQVPEPHALHPRLTTRQLRLGLAADPCVRTAWSYSGPKCSRSSRLLPAPSHSQNNTNDNHRNHRNPARNQSRSVQSTPIISSSLCFALRGSEPPASEASSPGASDNRISIEQTAHRKLFTIAHSRRNCGHPLLLPLASHQSGRSGPIRASMKHPSVRIGAVRDSLGIARRFHMSSAIFDQAASTLPTRFCTQIAPENHATGIAAGHAHSPAISCSLEACSPAASAARGHSRAQEPNPPRSMRRLRT